MGSVREKGQNGFQFDKTAENTLHHLLTNILTYKRQQAKIRKQILASYVRSVYEQK